MIWSRNVRSAVATGGTADIARTAGLGRKWPIADLRLPAGQLDRL